MGELAPPATKSAAPTPAEAEPSQEGGWPSGPQARQQRAGNRAAGRLARELGIPDSEDLVGRLRALGPLLD